MEFHFLQNLHTGWWRWTRAKEVLPKSQCSMLGSSALGFNFLGHLEASSWHPLSQESQSFPPFIFWGLGFPFSIPKEGGQAGGTGGGALTPIPKEEAALSLLPLEGARRGSVGGAGGIWGYP